MSDATRNYSDLKLRPVMPRDVPLLYALALSHSTREYWRYRGATPSPEEFQRDLWHDVLAQYILEIGRPPRPCGLVRLYAANMKNQLAYVSVLGFPRYRETGLVLAGFARFIDDVFRSWSFRKLYVEVLDSHAAQFASALDGVFSIEGRLIDFEFSDGRYHDVTVASVGRDDWLALRSHFSNAARERALAILRASDDQPMTPAAFCDFFSELLSEVGKASVPVELDTSLVDAIALDSLERLQLLDVWEELVPGGIDLASDAQSFDSVREFYLLYLQALQMPLNDSETGSRDKIVT